MNINSDFVLFEIQAYDRHVTQCFYNACTNISLVFGKLETY